ncbi:MAG: FKBP-type peptidyl-prolyl cis-trans isomerase [Ferruginibacter sp.]
MKTVLISSVFLFAAVLSVSAQSGKKPATRATTKSTTKTAAKPTTPTFKNLLDSFSYAAGFNVATNMKAQGINKLNVEMMQKGLDDVFKNTPSALTTEASGTCMQKQLAIFASEKGDADKAKGRAFLEANKKRKEVITLPDGLQYEIIKSGDVNGKQPTLADSAVVHYIGTLIDGVEFDNSYKRGQPYATLLTQVVQGWTEILQMMKPGDQWKVYVPSELAYDENGAGGGSIPPHSVLIFDMTLVEIRPVIAKTGQ